VGVGAGLYMYVVVVQKFTFAISSPDEFLSSDGSLAESVTNRFVIGIFLKFAVNFLTHFYCCLISVHVSNVVFWWSAVCSAKVSKIVCISLCYSVFYFVYITFVEPMHKIPEVFDGVQSDTLGKLAIKRLNDSGFYWSKRWRGGTGIRWTICKSFAPCSRQITMPAPHHSIFCRPDALSDTQPTVSKYWRQKQCQTTETIYQAPRENRGICGIQNIKNCSKTTAGGFLIVLWH